MATKFELVNQLADKAGLTKVDASKALDSMSGIIAKILSKGDKVTWTGFGTFEVRHRAARTGRNPQTGAPMHIPATKSPAFKAGKGLKDAVR
jgi:DNA-binding protein HU-beta